MSLWNVAYAPALEWASPQVRTLEAQARRPLFNEDPVEMGFGADEAGLLRALRDDPATRTAFEAAFPDAEDAVTTEHLSFALAAYQRTLISGRSSYDRLVYEDDSRALAPSARRGMNLFFSERTGCARCHDGLLFSGSFDAVGLPPAEPRFVRNGLPIDRNDRGAAEVTGDPADAGRFRIPTLRNVALTAPYMHDGRFETLDEVLDHYAGADDPEFELHPFVLSPDERRDLIAFLAALTGETP